MLFNFFRRTPSAPARTSKAAAPANDGAFHAVDIVSNGPTCRAAQHLAGTRFLSRERPPQLPLGNCDMSATCACRYRHHEDRRKELRRQSDHAWGTAAPLPADRERRRAHGRRATDR